MNTFLGLNGVLIFWAYPPLIAPIAIGAWGRVRRPAPMYIGVILLLALATLAGIRFTRLRKVDSPRNEKIKPAPIPLQPKNP